MNICNHHLFGFILFFIVVIIGIISTIKEENDGEPTTADEYNKEWLNEDKYDEIKELITDLEWETDRMSSSGRETLDALWKIFKIEGN